MAHLIATPGAANANSYVLANEASEYIEHRLYTSAYDSASETDIEKALLMSTYMLEQLPWNGSKYYTAGALRWPRSGLYDLDGIALSSTVIPEFLKYAVFNLALYLLEDNRVADPDTVGFKKIKADVIELEIDKYSRKKAIPTYVMEIVKPYITDVGISLVRR